MFRLIHFAVVLLLYLARVADAHGDHEMPEGEVVSSDPIVRPYCPIDRPRLAVH